MDGTTTHHFMTIIITNLKNSLVNIQKLSNQKTQIKGLSAYILDGEVIRLSQYLTQLQTSFLIFGRYGEEKILQSQLEKMQLEKLFQT